MGNANESVLLEGMQGTGHSGVPSAMVFFLMVIPAVVLILYLLAIWRERNAPKLGAWRIAAFSAGIALLMIAGSPALSQWAHDQLRGHMLQHLILGMFAPLALVMGAPVTVLLRNVPTRAARTLVAATGRLPIQFMVHPATAAALDVGALYLLYLTPLFALSQSSPTVHVIVHLHFVIWGCIFAWSIAGPDPARHRPGMPTRLAVLFLAMAAHANLGKIMYGYGYPRGTMAGIEEIRLAAMWMYYGGSFAEILLTIAFFAVWYNMPASRRRMGGVTSTRLPPTDTALLNPPDGSDSCAGPARETLCHPDGRKG